MIVIVLVEIAIVVTVSIKKDEVQKIVSKELQNNIAEYYKDEKIKQAWHSVQTEVWIQLQHKTQFITN